MSLPFKNYEVEEIVKAAKFITALPDVQKTSGEYTMKAKIKRNDAPKLELSLVILAHAKLQVPPLPKNIPACVLLWRGERIRGVNFELWHDNFDGTIVKGWHEHIWNEQDRDCRVGLE